MLHNVFPSCLTAAGVRVILYDEASVREEERGGRVGKGGGVNLEGHHHWSWIPLQQLLKVCSTHGNVWTCKHTPKRLALSFLLLPTAASRSAWLCATGWQGSVFDYSERERGGKRERDREGDCPIDPLIGVMTSCLDKLFLYNFSNSVSWFSPSISVYVCLLVLNTDAITWVENI